MKLAVLCHSLHLTVSARVKRTSDYWGLLFSAFITNKSGLIALKKSNRAFGIPFFRHDETDEVLHSHSLATAHVPSRASIILLASIFMDVMIVISSRYCQAISSK